MIVSETPNRVNSRWSHVCALLCAIVVLPLGVVYAQDYEAVGKRLRAAVEAKELTGEQAKAMLATLKKTGAQKDQGSGAAKAYLMKVKKELGALIEAGKISEEDAAKRFEGAEKTIKEKLAAGRGEHGSNLITREDFARAAGDLKKLVAEGKISEEDARARFGAMRRMIGEQSEGAAKKITREDLSRAGIEIRKAVAAGKLSAEDGRAKMEAMRKMAGEQGEGADKEGAKRKITAEEVGKRLRSAPGLAVQVSGPQNLAIDATATYRIEVSNPGDLPAKGVVASAVVPSILKFLTSEPQAEQFGERVQWRLGDLAPRETRLMEVQCRAVREGNIRFCAQASAEGDLKAEGCTDTRTSMPALDVRFKEAPTQANVGQLIKFSIEVRNVGTVSLTDVVVRDRFDPGLEHRYGQPSPIVRSLGDLAPGRMSVIDVSFYARVPGRLCHSVDVSSAEGQSGVARACVDVTQPRTEVQLELLGARQAQVGQAIADGKISAEDARARLERVPTRFV